MGSIAIDPDMSDSCASSPEPPSPLLDHATTSSASGKRSAADAGLKTASVRPAKSVKRRASKACQCCRSRKVRCNVVEQGPPCTNCRLDEVACVVSESKRKKKWTSGPEIASPAANKPPAFKSSASLPMSAVPPYEPLRRHSEHVPHSLYQDLGRDAGRNSVADMRQALFGPSSLLTMSDLSHQGSETSTTSRHQSSMTDSATYENNRLLSPSTPGCGLPAFIKPLPKRLAPDDIAYLERKGALTMPYAPLRDELLRSYAEFVHPYLPLIDLHDLVAGIDRNDGSNQVSLLVFQAIMFAGVATADQAQLERAGYSSRRDARRDFFHRTRVLYDLDVELDRISIIQALLLMTHWYETPDDLKDSHHWMGIAVSLAHSIGLHRDPDRSASNAAASPGVARRRRLWRRIWWSTYMRDRLIALGMRRPTRIKSSDFDVAMLSLADFGLDEIPATTGLSCMPVPCRPFDDATTRRQMAVMCIEKVRLCVAMSHILSVQYSVLHNTDDVGGATRTTSLLAPRARPNEPEIDEVAECDAELRQWRENLAPEACFVQPAWHDIEAGHASLVLNRCLLHMMYYATLSALHRPQVLPSSASAAQSRGPSADGVELSRRSVRLAASEITEIANSLNRLDLVRCMPTTGITFLMPAIIIHLLDIKAADEDTRRASLKGFCDCMQAMAKLRDMYAAADYSTAFLEAAIRKAEITLPPQHALNAVGGSIAGSTASPAGFMHSSARPTLITSSQGLVDAGRRLHLVDTPASGALTPPPDDAAKLSAALLAGQGVGAHLPDDTDLTDDTSASSFSAAVGMRNPFHLRLPPAPPAFVSDLLAASLGGLGTAQQPEYEPDFDALINLDAAGDVWPSLTAGDADPAVFLPGGEGAAAGFAALGEVEWMKGLRHADPALGGLGEAAHPAYPLTLVSSSPAPLQPHNGTIAPSPPKSPRESSAGGENQVQQSPVLSRLPPQTPSAARQEHRPPSQEPGLDWYTAAWGSPYAVSPAQGTLPSIAAHVEGAQHSSSSSPSSHLRSGPAPLVPSRLDDSYRSPNRRSDADAELTPRSHAKRWVQLPRREAQADETHWWTDGDDDPVTRHRIGEKDSTRPFVRGHRSRDINRTLDQQSFWDLQKPRLANMSSLMASRWADESDEENGPAKGIAKEGAIAQTSVLEHDVLADEEQLAAPETHGIEASRWAVAPSSEPAKVQSSIVKPSSGMTASRWADTPSASAGSEAAATASSLETSRWAATPAAQEPSASEAQTPEEDQTMDATVDSGEAPGTVPRDTQVPADSKGEDEARTPSEQLKALPPPSPVKSRLDLPRQRKKINWRGKTCVILIPRLDHDALDLVLPLSSEQVHARLREFERQGYDTRGFDLLGEVGHAAGSQLRPVFPDDTTIRAMAGHEGASVRLPDTQSWAAYTDWLMEQKLAALGVSTSLDEPINDAVREATTSRSRQSSSQYPPAPFSPPISTTSGASMGRPGLSRGHSASMSVASPVSPVSSAFGHMHRHSTLMGNPLAYAHPYQQNDGFSHPGMGTFSPPVQHALQPGMSIPGMQSFSPMLQNQYTVPAFDRAFSPPQVGDLRGLYSAPHGPGSALGQQALAQQADGQLAGVDSQNVTEYISGPNHILSMGSSAHMTPSLPHLPEEDDRDELLEKPELDADLQSEQMAYLPPHKRTQLNANISAPTPRGHRHNISEGLERDAWKAEERNSSQERVAPAVNTERQAEPELEEKDPLGQDITVTESPHSRKKSGTRLNVAAPAFSFNPAAVFQPGSTVFNFAPPPKMQSSQMPTAKPGGPTFSSHSRKISTGFNAAAPPFQPSGSFQQFGSAPLSASALDFSAKGKPTVAPTLPTSDFNFAAPAIFRQSISSSEQQLESEPTTAIFGKVTIPDLIKPPRRNKAVAIVPPEAGDGSDADEGGDDLSRDGNEDFEDDEGRIAQKEDRLKRQRKSAPDGDEVPRFAEPSSPLEPAAVVVQGETRSSLGTPGQSLVQQIDGQAGAPELPQEADDLQLSHGEDELRARQQQTQTPLAVRRHKFSSSLSALATPFEMPALQRNSSAASLARLSDGYASDSHLVDADLAAADLADADLSDARIPNAGQPDLHVPNASRSASQESRRPPEIDELQDQQSEDLQPPEQLEDGEILADQPEREAWESLRMDVVHTPPVPPKSPLRPQLSESIDQSAQDQPSFDEIDAAMRQINDDQHADAGAEPELAALDAALPPFTLPVAGAERSEDADFLPPWPRSAGPSPSPSRLPIDSSFTAQERTGSEETAMNGWPAVNRLNKAVEGPISDWSDLLSPLDQAKLEQRTVFFDSRIEEVIGRAVEKRLQPLEDSLRVFQSSVVRRSSSNEIFSEQRRQSIFGSDADDEDELTDEYDRRRPISSGRDKRMDQIKAAVVEALRDQSRRTSHAAQSPAYDLTELQSALANIQASVSRTPVAGLELDDVRAVIEEALGKQAVATVPGARGMETVDAAQHRRELSELEGRFNETLAGALAEADLRHRSEEREAESRRLLELADEELQLLRTANRDDQARLSAAERERDALHERLRQAESAQRKHEQQIDDLHAERDATMATLDEYRVSKQKWRQSLDDSSRDREELEETIADLERQLDDGQEAGGSMRRRLEKLSADMVQAADQLAAEKAEWQERERDYRSRCELLESERTQARDELSMLQADAAKAAEAARALLDQANASGASLEETVGRLKNDLAGQRALAARLERDLDESKEAGRLELQRVRVAMETEAGMAKHQADVGRMELDTEVTRLRLEVENVRLAANAATTRHERAIEEGMKVHREALQKLDNASNVALEEVRQKHEKALEESAATHTRLLGHAREDKDRSEYILNERLSLADEKLQHYQDKVLLLEEKLEIAKHAAQAAALNAQSRSLPALTSRASSIPDKVSPQALRESILVLQEQLQEREARIEKLQTQVDKEAPAKLKARDDEIVWLRELLAVRSDELTALINTLSKPTFDRDGVRDAAIRIRANLQMEQQERERYGSSRQTPSGPALASLSNFATPRAASLTSAFNKWRQNMESSALKNAPRSSPRGTGPRRSGIASHANTPSKPPPPPPQQSSSAMPPGFLAGLMTPPSSNLRLSPSPEPTTDSLPPPRLVPRVDGAATQLTVTSEPPRPRSRHLSGGSVDGPTTPLFRSQSYDRDAEDSALHLAAFDEDDENEDEDLESVADERPPAFRSLEDELAADEGDESS